MNFHANLGHKEFISAVFFSVHAVEGDLLITDIFYSTLTISEPRLANMVFRLITISKPSKANMVSDSMRLINGLSPIGNIDVKITMDRY